MGRKKQNPETKNPQNEELLGTLGDFTSKENWDKFFFIRGNDDSFEWYAEWAQLREPLLSNLYSTPDTPSAQPQAKENLEILVPGCGNSRLSEHLYDEGFLSITNIDFSKVVISHMLRRNVRDRSGMRWRVMDMTSMQFEDGVFDVVLDKGGLDALMEPELGSELGNQYLLEVKRVLKIGGKFVCFTLAESHVLGLLFSKFRFGWKMVLHSIPQVPRNKPGLRTFMAVVEKVNPRFVDQIVSSFDHSSCEVNGDQADGLHKTLETENSIRRQYLDGSDIMYSLEDLQLGADGDLMELRPGRRVQLILGGLGESRFCYKTTLLDAQPEYAPFSYQCGVFIVPKTRVHEWLFSSEEGQWMVVESSKAARLILVLLDSTHLVVSMDEIQKDLSPLVKQLEPLKDSTGLPIPFMMAGDGIKHRKIVHQDMSELTGPMVVEDVIYEKVDDHLVSLFPTDALIFRRLIFQRTEGLVQSEALLLKESSPLHSSDTESTKKKTGSASKSKKKQKQKTKELQQSLPTELCGSLEVDHSFLVSSYHTGIVAGFTLISTYLERMATSGRLIETVVIGLGAGLLPMFLHKFMPFFQVEVVELDPVVLNTAQDCFSFHEDARLKVHVADGVDYIKKHNSNSASVREVADNYRLEEKTASTDSSFIPETETKARNIDILIIDVDSSDSSSGLSCPAADFIEDSFLSIVKDILNKQGLFVINLVSRSPTIKHEVVSRMKMMFNHLYSLQLEEDVNEVLFALSSSPCIEENDDLSEAAIRLERMLKLDHPERTRAIMEATKKITRLK